MKSFVFFIEISLNIVPRRPTDNKAALVQVTVLSNRTRFLVEVFKCIWGLNPEFMSTVFVMGNWHYDTRNGSNTSQNRVKTIKYGIQIAYQGA